LIREPGKKYIFGDDDFGIVAEKTVLQTRKDFKALVPN
jgi:hypothetical protein